ncbi:MAG: hypothetical protein WDM77_20320 [Steroidobacteraceae bacterium]
MKTNKLGLLLTLALMATCLLNACDQAKSPDQVAKDTATAEANASEATAKAEQTAGDKVNSAQTVVQDEQAAADHTRAVQMEKVNSTQAEGNHKIALAQCETLAGESQKACKDQADTAYATAQALAKQAKADTDPKP